jgi:glycosyltransferase involved in cell wall biosynthesis
MNRNQYDLVFLTNSPAFYKINLYNKIAEEINIFVFFLAAQNDIVVKETNTDKYSFDYCFLSEKTLKTRSKLKVLLQLFKKLQKIQYKKIIYSGWIYPEFVIPAFLTPKYKNCALCESSVYESKIDGIKKYIKKAIINRMSLILPSGTSNKQIFDRLGYKGKIVLTGGVGLFNKNGDRRNRIYKPVQLFKYLYVGRLIDIKNIELLIDVFNQNGKSLTIAGTGELETFLKLKAQSNIIFLGFIENKKMYSVYQDHDIFILPSKNEPWGLVVEEAIYNGLPVIVSNQVGCNIDMVQQPNTGLIFRYNDKSSLRYAVDEMESKYLFFKSNVNRFDFEKRDKEQVATYVQLVR